jgi:acyl-homoserine lactone acylase PvdQ
MKVIRDEWGVPHIGADDEAEAFRALGYAQAEDNLPRILKLYTILQGCAAAAFGPEWIGSDRNQRRWRHFSAASRQLDSLDARDRALYDAFIDGIGAYMDEHPADLPDLTPYLHPALPIAAYRTYLWTYMILDAAEAATRGGLLDPSILAESASVARIQDSASNEILVMPQKTVEGVMVVLSDPHGAIAEFPMYEYRLRAGRFDFIGVAVVGGMLPILGHTADVAWGATTGHPRSSDCYLLETRHEGREYRHGDEWRPVLRRRETIEVRDSEPAVIELESVTLNGVECPVIGRDGSRIAVACTPYMAEDCPPMDASLLGWIAARSLDEWRDATALMCLFEQNFLAGDRYGNAMYVRLGRVPRRADSVDPRLPIEGYNERTRWQGLHGFDELVQIRNPSSGYMHNNNEAPDAMFRGAPNSALSADNYPSYIFNDTPGRTHDRGLRTEQVLGGEGKVGVDDVIALALSDVWPTAPRWRDALVLASAGKTDGWTADEQAVLGDLLSFGGESGPESTAALAYHYWRTSLHLVLDPDADLSGRPIGTPLPAAEALKGAYPNSRALWLAVESDQDLDETQQHSLLEAVRIGTRRMLDDLGRVDVPFGDVFRIGRGEADWPARSAMFPAYGEEMVGLGDNVMPIRLMFGPPRGPDGKRRVSEGGRSWRLTAFTDPIRSYSVVLYGQSSRPESPHFSDQARLYSEHRVRETGFATVLDKGVAP